MAGRRKSAGLIMFRRINGEPEVFLAHPGGPYFHKKDEGHWSIPKGEPEVEEELLVTAIREFKEETGITPIGDFIPLGSIVQKGGKEVFAWAFESDLPPNYIHECNIYEEEWPPHSGEFKEFPEVDKVGFFGIDEAKQKIKGAQIPLIDRLLKIISSAEDQ
ncbi:MAG: NUDIX domain-containing protein [Ignavibacteria bacterium]|nr:NUDIX domain-containing protein [Ignavibacteria bacterium]